MVSCAGPEISSFDDVKGGVSCRTSCSLSGWLSTRRSHRSHVHEATIRRGESQAPQGLSALHGGARLPPSVHGGRQHGAVSGGRRSGPRQDAGRPGHHRPRHPITSGTTSNGSTSPTSAATAASRAPISPSCRWAGQSNGRSRWRPGSRCWPRSWRIAKANPGSLTAS